MSDFGVGAVSEKRPNVAVCCETCVFYVSLNAQGGNCHADPPQGFMIPGTPDAIGRPTIALQGSWPPTRPEWWCGRHPMFGGIPIPIDKRLAGEAEGRG